VSEAAQLDADAKVPSGLEPGWKTPLLHVELTNYCNLKCTICPHPIMRRPKGLMDLDLALRLVEEARGRVHELNFSYFGEPLLYPKLAQVVEPLADVDYRVVMNTNAVLLDEKRRPLLTRERFDQVRLSLDSSVPETYATIRIGSQYERVVNNTLAYLDMPRRAPVRLVMVSSSVNRDEHEAFLEHWKPHLHPGDEILIKNILSWTGIVRDEEQIENRVCPLWSGQVVVGWDGRVGACFLDYEMELEIGRIDEVDPFAILRDPRYRELARQYHLETNPTCNRCFDKNKKITLWRAG
jgi:sulfatase maturation enzyme AslB (radical SAM superfamily)